MPGIHAVPAADLELLRRYDTPTICNVVELFDLRPRTAGYLDGRIRACYPKMPPAVGYASTATFRSAAPPRSGDVYSGLAEQVASFAELPGPAVVVFQDLDDPPAAAVFGEVMCTTYQAFGAVGLVTNGAGRDLDQVEALGFPVFTGGTICRPRLLSHSGDQPGGARGRCGDPPRRPSARRPQRRDDDPH